MGDTDRSVVKMVTRMEDSVSISFGGESPLGNDLNGRKSPLGVFAERNGHHFVGSPKHGAEVRAAAVRLPDLVDSFLMN